MNHILLVESLLTLQKLQHWTYFLILCLGKNPSVLQQSCKMIPAVVYLAIQAIGFDRWPARTVFWRQTIHLSTACDGRGSAVAGGSGTTWAHSALQAWRGISLLSSPLPSPSPLPAPTYLPWLPASASQPHVLPSGHMDTRRHTDSPCPRQARKLCLTLPNAQLSRWELKTAPARARLDVFLSAGYTPSSWCSIFSIGGAARCRLHQRVVFHRPPEVVPGAALIGLSADPACHSHRQLPQKGCLSERSSGVSDFLSLFGFCL